MGYEIGYIRTDAEQDYTMDSSGQRVNTKTITGRETTPWLETEKLAALVLGTRGVSLG